MTDMTDCGLYRHNCCVKLDGAQEQIEKLAAVLLLEFGGPTQSESACEMAVRLLREQKKGIVAASTVSFTVDVERLIYAVLMEERELPGLKVEDSQGKLVKKFEELRTAYDAMCDEVVKVKAERDRIFDVLTQKEAALTDLYQRFNLGTPS